MGFSIEADGLVCINHETNHYAVTAANIGKSPCLVKTKCNSNPITIYSVYYRPKNLKKSHHQGDNCPFIYAWKKKVPELYITRCSLNGMREEFYKILDQMIERMLKDNTVDFIVPMPSKHCLASSLAKRINRYIPDAKIIENLFVKRSNDEIVAQIKKSNLGSVDKSRLLRVIDIANQSGRGFSISDVNVSLRQYLDPIEMVKDIIPEGTYLLVDDLFATGSTMVNAKIKIVSNNERNKILGAVLFSPYLNKIH